jgi:hypothetical protein
VETRSVPVPEPGDIFLAMPADPERPQKILYGFFPGKSVFKYDKNALLFSSYL